jgi:hypothetical protein
MSDARDICDRLEDTSYDGAFAMRRDAARLIRQLRYYTTRLEVDLAKLEAAAESLREHIAQQQLDIVTLGQEVGRLREAMEKIAYLESSQVRGKPRRTTVEEIARAALGEEK